MDTWATSDSLSLIMIVWLLIFLLCLFSVYPSTLSSTLYDMSLCLCVCVVVCCVVWIVWPSPRTGEGPRSSSIRQGPKWDKRGLYPTPPWPHLLLVLLHHHGVRMFITVSTMVFTTRGERDIIIAIDRCRSGKLRLVAVTERQLATSVKLATDLAPVFPPSLNLSLYYYY